ncbi:MAG: CoA-binding protein [Candidatus Thermoplasmatota archaeon]|nr:CoA-binding protein [Candidatus Thermoplasmatota archaeon]
MSLDEMFYPESVAVIGASNKEGKVGNSIMRSLKRKYDGEVFPVNISEDKVLGLKAYSSILEIDEKIDLAVVSVPAEVVPDVVDECGDAGVKNVIVVSAGFSEAGRRDLEREVEDLVEKYGMNLLGPNCLGIYNPSIELDTIFNPPEKQDRPNAGSISFLSQSGAFGAAVLDWFSEEGIGLSKFVSYGNRADIDESDLIEYLSEDDETEQILFYIEGLKHGRKFFSAAERSDKPILAVKSGRTKEGSSAANSHTASLAGKDKVYEGVFSQSSILRLRDLREMINIAKSLSFQPLPEGDRVGIVTNGGGAGVMATDALVERGLRLASFSSETQAKFRKAVKRGIIPEHATLNNPVDIIGDAPAKRYRRAMKITLEEKDVDVLLIILLAQSPSLEEDIVDVLDDMQDEGKPIIAVAPGGRHTKELRKKIEKRDIPVYQTPEEGIDAIWGLCRCCEIQDKKDV